MQVTLQLFSHSPTPTTIESLTLGYGIKLLPNYVPHRRFTFIQATPTNTYTYRKSRNSTVIYKKQQPPTLVTNSSSKVCLLNETITRPQVSPHVVMVFFDRKLQTHVCQQARCLIITSHVLVNTTQRLSKYCAKARCLWEYKWGEFLIQ